MSKRDIGCSAISGMKQKATVLAACYIGGSGIQDPAYAIKFYTEDGKYGLYGKILDVHGKK